MIHLTKIAGEFVEDANITQIQKELHKLFLSKDGSDVVFIMNDSELSLDIYHQTVILQDYGSYKYDGPDGPGEMLSLRYKEGTILHKIEKIIALLENDEREELIKLLNTLPKPN